MLPSFTPFESALSSGGGVGGSVEQRLGKLEKSMAEIADSLKRLAPPAEAPATRPSALRSSPKYAAKNPKDQSTPPASRVEGMDLEVLRSAREAGVPDSQISQMLELASKGKPQLTDVPPPRKKVSILSDSEDEDEEELQEATDTAASGGESKVLVSAVSKLTKIASQLAARRKKDRSLEGVLDGVGSGFRKQWTDRHSEACCSFEGTEGCATAATRGALQSSGGKSREGLQCGEPSAWQCISASDSSCLAGDEKPRAELSKPLLASCGG